MTVWYPGLIVCCPRTSRLYSKYCIKVLESSPRVLQVSHIDPKWRRPLPSVVWVVSESEESNVHIIDVLGKSKTNNSSQKVT